MSLDVNNSFESIVADIEQRPNVGQRVMSQLRRLDWVEVGVGTAGVALVGLCVWGGLSENQQGGVQKSLRTEAVHTIPGYQSLSVDGTIMNYNEGSLHDATVTLISGAECNVQFTPTKAAGFWATFFPDHAKIVSFGTCPTDSQIQ